MVCQRCIMTVENILNSLHISYNKISLGEVDLSVKPAINALKKLEKDLHKAGFELIETRVNKIIEDIKQALIEYLKLGMDS